MYPLSIVWVMKMKDLKNYSSEQAIDDAVNALRCGKIVAFPTETVYGLGADARNLKAVTRIFQVKQRPLNHPLIVHLPHLSHLEYWAADITAETWRLAERFWPGPLTLIVKCAAGVLDEVTGGQPFIGLRVPKHPVAQALLNAFNGGIAAPSANRFGYISPTSALHVQTELGSDVDIILDGGACPIGIESTIVDMSSHEAKILRLGAITPKMIHSVVQCKPMDNVSEVRAPGALNSHYAPTNPLFVLPTKKMYLAIPKLLSQNKRVIVISFDLSLIDLHENVRWISMPNNAKDYSRMLYAILREADAEKPAVILVEEPPDRMEWLAVRDRLKKAKTSSVI